MDEDSMARLGRVCLIMGDEFTKLSDALKAFNDAMVAMAAGIESEAETRTDDNRYPFADLRKILEEMFAKEAAAELADLGEIVEEAADIPQPRKMPRPPKCTGPVNKANYTANRPPRVARSSCRTIKR